jgi:hypothetical protein
MNKLEEDIEIKPFRQIEHEYIGYQSLTDVPKMLEYSEIDKDINVSCFQIIISAHYISLN